MPFDQLGNMAIAFLERLIRHLEIFARALAFRLGTGMQIVKICLTLFLELPQRRDRQCAYDDHWRQPPQRLKGPYRE